MKKILLFLVFLCASHLVQAQNCNTKPGFIITSAGDTLRGLIRDKVDLSQQLSFKATADTEFKTYTPNDIPAFYIEGDYFFQSKAVVPDQKLFLLTLVSGTLNLYQYSGQVVFYLQKKDGILRKMEKSDAVVGDEYKNDIRYRNILNNFTAECPDMARLINRSNFNDRDLINVVETYNNCVTPGATAKVFKTVTKLRVQKGVKLGWFHSNLKYVKDYGRFGSYDKDFIAENNFSGGIFLRFYYKEKWSVQPELLFTQKGATVHYRTIYGESEISEFSFDYLQLPISVYYTFPTKQWKPFLYGGGVLGYALSREVTRTLDGTVQTPNIVLDKDDWGLRGGAGVQWQLNTATALQLEYLYESSLTNRTSLDQKINHRGHSVKIGILF